MLTLPLWIVTEHIQPTNPDATAEKTPGTAFAFSTSNKLFKFMSAHLGGEWKMEMAADGQGLIILIADLHRLEIANLILDPELDGSGGQPTPLADLMELANTLTNDDKVSMAGPAKKKARHERGLQPLPIGRPQRDRNSQASGAKKKPAFPCGHSLGYP